MISWELTLFAPHLCPDQETPAQPLIQLFLETFSMEEGEDSQFFKLEEHEEENQIISSPSKQQQQQQQRIPQKFDLSSFLYSKPGIKPKKPAAKTLPLPMPNSGQSSSISSPLKRKSSLSTSSSPSPRKKARTPAKYAPPSTYAHLPFLPDVLAPNLLILFVGLNPGIRTSTSGHAYSHPSNLFWKLLYSSGITDRLVPATEDRNLPELYSCGNTNIVERPTRNGAELKKAELDGGFEALEGKVRTWRPECVCLVGKGIWESVWRVRKGKAIQKQEFSYGWQSEGENMGVVKGQWEGAKVFVASSTSGLAATLLPKQKEAIWKELGDWVNERRRQRGGEGGGSGIITGRGLELNGKTDNI